MPRRLALVAKQGDALDARARDADPVRAAAETPDHVGSRPRRGRFAQTPRRTARSARRTAPRSATHRRAGRRRLPDARGSSAPCARSSGPSNPNAAPRRAQAPVGCGSCRRSSSTSVPFASTMRTATPVATSASPTGRTARVLQRRELRTPPTPHSRTIASLLRYVRVRRGSRRPSLDSQTASVGGMGCGWPSVGSEPATRSLVAMRRSWLRPSSPSL